MFCICLCVELLLPATQHYNMELLQLRTIFSQSLHMWEAENCISFVFCIRLTPVPVCVLQGTPEFVAVSQCVHYFEWRTYAACKRDKFKPHKEVCGGTSDSPMRRFLCVEASDVRNQEPQRCFRGNRKCSSHSCEDVLHVVRTCHMLLQ